MDFDGLKYQVYKSKTSNFFEDLIEFKLNYDGKLDIDDFNMFSKVMVTYFNTGVFNEFIGGKYKLCKLDGQEHYAMYDFLNKSPINNLYIAHDTYEAIEKKYNYQYVEKMENFINNIESSIYDSTDNFITKRTKYSEQMKVVEFLLNEKELKFQDSFFKSEIGSPYAVNFKHQTLRNLLQEKLNIDSTLQSVFCADFAEHYKLLMKTFQHDFYPEFKDSEYQFNKQCHFMRDELDLLYMPPKTDHFEYSRNIDHNWVLFHQNNRYAGGAIISNSAVSEIRHISLKSSVENKDNFKKALDDILSSNVCNQSVFIMTPQIQKYGLENELRNQYKDRQLYFNYSEKDAYFTLEAFVELNNLGLHEKKIKNDFYKNVILKHEKIFNSSNLLSYTYSANESVVDLLMDKFKLDVLNKYSKNVSNLEEVDRESFIRKCFVFQQGENNYKHYLQNDYEGMDFSFKLPLDGNGTTDLLNMVKDFILYQNINYSQDVYQGIYDSINTNKQIATHESTNAQFLTYSYHSLYETLSDLGCIKTSQDLTYVFRLEMKDGKGLYTSAYSDDYITKSNDAAILEYDQRKVPQRDNGLSTLFLAYDSRHLITNSYADNYNFAFSSKEQMLRWFGQNELDKLAAQGTKLYRCEVPQVNVIASKVQVAFNKNKVISKVELKLGEFLQKEETPTIKKINKFKI